MDDIHAPNVGASSASQPTENGVHGTKTLPELIARKDSLESELKALGAVLDSVWSLIMGKVKACWPLPIVTHACTNS